MNDLIIKVSKRSRLIDLDHSTLGIVGENLQEKLIFIFQDEFVDGMARLEYDLTGEKRYVLMEKVGQSYILPVQNVLLTKEGNIDLQLVITEDKTGTPVFKSEVFTLYCKKSIEAVGEAPSSYELWIEKANRILLEASRVNIDGKKTGNETLITITQRDGNKKSFPILDGQDGQQGPQGPVGPQGPEGPEGPQGPVGPTPDLSNYVQKTEFNASQAEQDDTTRELQAELDRYKLLENALPHTQNVTPSDYVTLNNTAKSPMEVSLTPQTSQDGEPTPDNPQEINRTTGENQVKVVGNNLLNIENSEEGGIDASGTEVSGDTLWRGNEFLKVLPNTAYTFSSNKSMTLRLYQYDENYIFIPPREEARSNTFLTITTGSSTRYLKFSIYDNGTHFTKELVETYDLQIEQSSTATPYKPYEETTYPLSLGNKEMFNNNVSDGFVYDENEDKFYINRKNGKIVLNGEENWTRYIDNVYLLSLPNIKPTTATTDTGSVLSNYYIATTQYKMSNNQIDYGITVRANQNQLLVKNKDISSPADFKSWLSTHNTTVVYQLATSTLEEIIDTTLISQLRAIKNALSMQGTTHIISTASGSNLPFLIKARAVQTIERT